MKRVFNFYLLVGALIWSVCACTDDDYDGGNDQPSVSDTKLWPYDEGLNMDIAPGDDFYSYVTAGRTDNWENFPFDHADDIGEAAEDAINNDFSNPYISAVKALTGANYNLEKEAEYLREEYDRIDALQGDDLSRELLHSASIGTSKQIGLNMYFASRKVCVYFDEISRSDVTYADYNEDILGEVVSEEEYEDLCNTALGYISSGSESKPSRVIKDEILGDITLRQPVISTTRSSGLSDAHAAIVMSELGTQDLSYLAYSGGIESILTLVDQRPDDIRDILKADLLSSAVEYYEYSDNPWHILMESRVWRAHANRKFAQEQVTDAAVEYAKQMSENFRTAFSERLKNLDWMSPTTKTRAEAKLQAMHFFFGRVNGSYDDFIPQLDTDYTSIQQMQKDLEEKTTKMFLSTLGQELSDDVMMWAVILNGNNLFANNAFYNPISNAMFLLPCNILKPMTDITRSDAYNYAVLGATTIGHEMCHGFDASGSKYNELGDLEDWWTLSDKLLFKEKQSQMTTIFENYTLAGYSFDGAEKLTENMADFGGICVGLTALINLRQSQGYNEAGISESLRRYFISYAIAWNTKYDAATQCQFTEGDPHSPNVLRTNSNVNQLDEWYDIFDIQWGDRLYLTPEQRVSLW